MEWREPEPVGSLKWVEVAGELSARPGVWGMVVQAPSRNAASYPAASLRKLGCEVATRANGDGVEVFARWPDAEG